MYLALKLLHVAAVIVFLGNITTGLFWHAYAARTRDPKLLAHTMDGIIRSDRLFTLPGVLLIIATGVGLAAYGHFPLLRTGWILWTLVLFAISGIVFACARRAFAARAQGARRTRDPGRFRLRALSRARFALGGVGRRRAAHTRRGPSPDGPEADLTTAAGSTRRRSCRPARAPGRSTTARRSAAAPKSSPAGR